MYKLATIKFSTGRIENQTNEVYPENIFFTVDVSFLNNNRNDNAHIRVVLFDLSEEKVRVDVRKFRLSRRQGARPSRTVTFDVSGLESFEIYVVIKQEGSFREVKQSVLRNAIAFDETGEPTKLPLRPTV